MILDSDVVVIGAGLSGLVTAFALARAGLRVQVIEAAPRTGGVISTVRRDGMLYERGPNSALDTHPRISELLDQLGIAAERVEASTVSSRRYVLRDGTPAALPTSPTAFFSTRLFSAAAKLRLLREPFIAPAPATADESVTQFVTRRLGHELLDYAIEPFVAGVYAGNPDELSVTAAFPKLYALEQRYGSLIKGQIKGARERARRDERAKNVAGSFSFRDGMQTLTDALTRALPTVLVDTMVTRLERTQRGGFRVEASGSEAVQIASRAVVLAVPAPVAADLLRDHLPDAANALGGVLYAPVASVASLYARSAVAHALDGFGFLVPRVEQRRILGSLFSSSMFEGRAPEGKVLLTTFLGGRRQPEIALQSADDISRIVDGELTDLLGAGRPIDTAVTRWTAAIPQYTLGHLDRVRRIERAEGGLRGFFLCASYRGGVSVGDRIKSAYETAERILHHVHAPVH